MNTKFSMQVNIYLEWEDYKVRIYQAFKYYKNIQSSGLYKRKASKLKLYYLQWVDLTIFWYCLRLCYSIHLTILQKRRTIFVML